MHRSGTSCLAGSLEARGLYLAEVFEWSPHNLKGNRENAEVMRLNDDVLEASGGAWDRPPGPIVWSAQHAERRNGLIERCTQGFTTTWGFKDPRGVFTLPFWQDAALPTQLVGTFRHPVLVARSLEARNGMPISDGLALWTKYNTRLLEHRQARPFPLVSFDVSRDEYVLAIDRVADRLGLSRHEVHGAQPFIEDDLRHQDRDDSVTLPSDVARIYEHLMSAYQTLCAGPP